MKTEILKDNRTRIINKIENTTTENLKKMMIKVLEIAQIGGSFDMGDMEGIISNVKSNVKNNARKIMQEKTKASLKNESSKELFKKYLKTF